RVSDGNPLRRLLIGSKRHLLELVVHVYVTPPRHRSDRVVGALHRIRQEPDINIEESPSERFHGLSAEFLARGEVVDQISSSVTMIWLVAIASGFDGTGTCSVRPMMRTRRSVASAS